MTTRLPRLLTYSLTAALTATGLAIGLGSAAGASTIPAARPAPAAAASAASQAAAAKAAAKSAIEHLMIGQRSADHRVPGYARRGTRGLTDVESTNWSGYADTGSGFSQVSSSWTEPSASCSGGQTQLAAFWVGIDGYSSSSVEQDGTIIECYRRQAYQYTWWEMYPTNAIQVVGSSLSPGDQITASVTRSGTSYTLTVTDSSNPANSFSTTQSCSDCANSSAEWIAEAPSGSSGVYPLADFGTWSTSGASVTEGSSTGTISSFTDDQITMVTSSGATEATPSALSDGGSAFSVSWDRS
jgi:hypothetical protein